MRIAYRRLPSVATFSFMLKQDVPQVLVAQIQNAGSSPAETVSGTLFYVLDIQHLKPRLLVSSVWLAFHFQATRTKGTYFSWAHPVAFIAVFLDIYNLVYFRHFRCSWGLFF